MTIIKYLKKPCTLAIHIGTSFVLLSTVMQVHAQEAVNSIEKNDKVQGDKLSSRKVLSTPASMASATAWELRAEQWELTRSGESLLSLPVLDTVINTWLQDKHKKIEIQYPGGEEGEFWVQELADWLVSLGIPSSHMIIVPGSGADDVVKFNLIKQ